MIPDPRRPLDDDPQLAAMVAQARQRTTEDRNRHYGDVRALDLMSTLYA